MTEKLNHLACVSYSELDFRVDDPKIGEARPKQQRDQRTIPSHFSTARGHKFVNRQTIKQPNMAHPPLHHFLRSMIHKQTTDHQESHQQQWPKEAVEEQDFHTSCCWSVASDNAASHSTKKRVHWKEDGKGSLVDCRWGNSSWSSSQEYSRRFAIEKRVVTKTPPSSADLFLVCPKRRVSMEADQLVALLAIASVVRD